MHIDIYIAQAKQNLVEDAQVAAFAKKAAENSKKAEVVKKAEEAKKESDTVLLWCLLMIQFRGQLWHEQKWPTTCNMVVVYWIRFMVDGIAQKKLFTTAANKYRQVQRLIDQAFNILINYLVSHPHTPMLCDEHGNAYRNTRSCIAQLYIYIYVYNIYICIHVYMYIV